MGLNELTETAGNVLNAMSEFPNVRMNTGVTNRDKQIMTWQLPNGTLVQMYINPENFQIAESKQINYTRTKGGFVVQYWGDNLTRLTLSGTTGSSGIKGINILRDIYHSENRAFEIVAASQASELFDALQNNTLTSENLGQSLVPLVSQQLRERNFLLRPSLASLALGVKLFYQGANYKGFFTEFTTTESIQKLGLFDYSMTFMVTEIRGKRKNFMPWHREPLADDPTGQLMNALAASAGNAIRGFFGMSPQQNTPYEFHPESAPLSFGGDSFASLMGLEATGPTSAGQIR